MRCIYSRLHWFKTHIQMHAHEISEYQFKFLVSLVNMPQESSSLHTCRYVSHTLIESLIWNHLFSYLLTFLIRISIMCVFYKCRTLIFEKLLLISISRFEIYRLTVPTGTTKTNIELFLFLFNFHVYNILTSFNQKNYFFFDYFYESQLKFNLA